MNNIVITGSTGVLGRRVVRELVDAGHSVTGVTHSDRGRRILEGRGARAVTADVFDERSLSDAFAGATAVINLLTRIPPADRMGEPEAWQENDRLRRDASAAIAAAAGAAGAKRLVQESLAFVYADSGGEWVDEDAPLVPSGATATALVAEANARHNFDGDSVVLRFGYFMGPDSGLTQTDVENAREGLSPTVGPREAYRPTLWLDDAATAVVAALGSPAGVYNVADEDPPTRGEIDEALAAAVGRASLRPRFLEVPAEMEHAARSHRVSSRRLRDATGWRPQVRAGTDGWALVTQATLAA